MRQNTRKSLRPDIAYLHGERNSRPPDPSPSVSNIYQTAKRWLLGRFQAGLSVTTGTPASNFTKSVFSMDGGARMYGNANFQYDLSPKEYEDCLNVAQRLWRVNGQAKAFVATTVGYTVGEGISATSKNATIQQLLDELFVRTFGDVQLGQIEEASGLRVCGEVLWLLQDDGNGQINVVPLSPNVIAWVEWNLKRPVKVHVKEGVLPSKRTCLTIVDETSDALEGDCIYVAINRIRGMSRGVSDLYPISDLLDGYDSMLWVCSQRIKALLGFLWHFKFTGLTTEQLAAKQAEITSPQIGEVLVSNEKVEVVTPSVAMAANEVQQTAQVVKNALCTGALQPATFHSEGLSATKATGESMKSPAFKRLQVQQSEWVQCLRLLCKVAIRRAMPRLLALVGKIEDLFDLEVPEILHSDADPGTFNAQALALAQAQSQGWVSPDTGVDLFADIAGKAGLTIDPEAEKLKLEAIPPEYRATGNQDTLANAQQQMGVGA